MFIHEDGKTNIIQGDCFDSKIMEDVKRLKPNIGFLNPPYKTKKSDIEELEFVLNNLEVLEKNGTCIAIVPMSCMLAQTGKPYELKKKLLDEHTLEAVFSMPDELFINSNVGVVTCIVVITAHKSHPKTKETYFGYWKYDGFIKTKNKGRIDANKRWGDIRDKWIESYVNRRNVVGLCVTKKITADDEWCAEAYMETDYSKLKKEDFVNVVREYVAFSFLNDFSEYEKN